MVSGLRGPAPALNCLRDGLVVAPALSGPEARGVAPALPPTNQVALGHRLPLPVLFRPRRDGVTVSPLPASRRFAVGWRD